FIPPAQPVELAAPRAVQRIVRRLVLDQTCAFPDARLEVFGLRNEITERVGVDLCGDPAGFTNLKVVLCLFVRSGQVAVRWQGFGDWLAASSKAWLRCNSHRVPRWINSSHTA